jgi:hypothetical protein
MCFALRVLRMQIGYPADLSARQPKYFLLIALGNCSCIALPPASMQSKEKYPKKRAPGCRFDPAHRSF